MSKTTAVKNPTADAHAPMKRLVVAVFSLVIIALCVGGYVLASTKPALPPIDEAKAVAAGNNSVNVSVTDSAIVLTPAKPDNPVKVTVFEDFSCPYCAELGEATDADMRDGLENGSMEVELKMMSFLDRGREDGHSHKALAAFIAVAKSGDWSLTWNFRRAMMERQKEVYLNADNAKLAEIAADYGANSDVVKEISEGAYAQAAVDMDKVNQEQLKGIIGEVASPIVLINGEVVEGILSWPAQAKNIHDRPADNDKDEDVPSEAKN